MATKKKISKANLKKLLKRRAKLAAQRRARTAKSTRRTSPVRTGRAKIEPIIHPLFDTEAITAGTGRTIFFSRPVGQAAVAGFTKSRRDTNLDLASALPKPRVHIVTGIRVIPSMITGDTTASPTLNLNPDLTDMASTMRAIFEETVFTLEIGTKAYLQVPTNQLPGNVGLSLIGEANAETAASNEGHWGYALFGRGDYFSTLAARIKIPPLQSFAAKIEFPVASKNAVISGGLKVTVVLDGLLGREVM